jgi:hypothetical protein
MPGFLRKTLHVGLGFHTLGWMGRPGRRRKSIATGVNVSSVECWGKKNEVF